MTDRGKAYTVTLAAIVLIAAIGGVMAYEQVGEGHVGVERVFGDVTGQTYQPGPHFVMPWIGVQPVEVRPRTFTGTVDVTTLNGTTFDVKYVIRYRVQENEAADFVTEWQNIGQVEDRLIEPSVEDRLRRQGADIESSVIFQKAGRDELSSAATAILESEFNDEALVLESVQITGVGIPADYQRALNEKEIAKQVVQQEQYNIQAEEARKRQAIIQAEAEAEAIEIEGEALQDNPEVLRLRYIEAISPTDKVIISGTSGGTPVILDGTSDGSASTTDESGNKSASEVLGGG